MALPRPHLAGAASEICLPVAFSGHDDGQRHHAEVEHAVLVHRDDRGLDTVLAWVGSFVDGRCRKYEGRGLLHSFLQEACAVQDETVCLQVGDLAVPA